MPVCLSVCLSVCAWRVGRPVGRNYAHTDANYFLKRHGRSEGRGVIIGAEFAYPWSSCVHFALSRVGQSSSLHTLTMTVFWQSVCQHSTGLLLAHILVPIVEHEQHRAPSLQRLQDAGSQHRWIHRECCGRIGIDWLPRRLDKTCVHPAHACFGQCCSSDLCCACLIVSLLNTTCMGLVRLSPLLLRSRRVATSESFIKSSFRRGILY